MIPVGQESMFEHSALTPLACPPQQTIPRILEELRTMAIVGAAEGLHPLAFQSYSAMLMGWSSSGTTPKKAIPKRMSGQ